MTVLDMIRAAPAEASGPWACHPWPRHVLPRDAWRAMAAALAQDGAGLLGLWADPTHVHALLRHGLDIRIASVAVEATRYPALSATRPAASRFERMIRDLWGHEPEGGVDDRAWLDHGRWPLSHPQSPRPGLPGGAVEPPAFPALDESGLMQVPLGPNSGRPDEPAHLRLAVRGQTVARAEARLGYAHKGTLALMQGKSPRAAARFVARLAAEATVAHSLAFARAAESALGVAVPPRAVALRAAMLEHEQIAGHLDDVGRMADAAGLARLRDEAGWLREQWLRAAAQAFGHRLMMDVVVPGGLAADVAADQAAGWLRAADAMAGSLPALHRMAEPLLARLAGLAVIRGARTGVVGRAAGAAFDARALDPAHADRQPEPSPERYGDAAARCRVRLADIADSLRLIRILLSDLPDDPVATALPMESGEGLGCAESLRGTVWHWLRLDHGQIVAAFPCDPGWILWPLAEAALAGQDAADATMILLSCGLPVSGVDL
jgi:Ni,Fe-hydrogenase III large subunit